MTTTSVYRRGACTTAKVVATSPEVTSLLTRPGQLTAAEQFSRPMVSATSCIGH